jgi:hypothetical protein
MRLRWRLPVVLTACVVVAQFCSLDPLVDVVTWSAPASARLSYPVSHVVFTPFTLLADWLNGGSRRDLVGFGVWAVVAYALVRLLVRRTPPGGRALREAAYAVLFVAGLGGFVAWGYWVPRPIPRLVTTAQDLLVLDVHSHTALSHDGRRGFGAAQNAAWHRRAGFDAAFVTDHNVFGATHLWRLDAAGHLPRLLDGEELSLSGLHLVVLGTMGEIANQPYDASWDSTGVLIRRLAADSLYLIASLPEYWEHHWGAPLGELTTWGVDGFEIWTESPRAMDIPEVDRRAVIARCRLENRTMFGATDMHGFGNAATVWNLVRLPLWHSANDTALARALIRRFRSGGAAANQVVALRRWLPESRLGSAASVPVNLVMLLRTASRPHAALLVAWIWLVALAASRRRRVPARLNSASDSPPPTA